MPIDIPVVGARSAIWIAAQLHLLFAAFALGAPIFIVLCEYLGAARGPRNWRIRLPLVVAVAAAALLAILVMNTTVERIVVVLAAVLLLGVLLLVTPLGDHRYERLAHETMKAATIAYSFAAISGGLFGFLLMGPYGEFTSHLFEQFGPIFATYGLLIVVESLLVYMYWYSWRPLAHRKQLHITIGVVMIMVGTAMMFLMNGLAAYMLTPPESPETASLWSLINNSSWTGLSLHRFIANITFGGFMVALFAAVMYLTAKKEEDRAFYDWMGYIGNFIGIGTLMVLPLAGYIYAKELFEFDATISTFLMADKLSSFFVMQGLLVSLLFLGANYYMWQSIQRIEGGARFLGYMRPIFTAMIVAIAIWITPQTFLPDLTTDAPSGIDPASIIITERLAFIGLMMAKALSVTGIIIFTFLTYMIYRRAVSTGSIRWGHIAPQAQYTLIFIPAVAVYLMALMGAIRELARQDWHVYLQIRDTTPYWFTPTLGHTSVMAGLSTLIFFTFMAFIFWIAFKLGWAD